MVKLIIVGEIINDVVLKPTKDDDKKFFIHLVVRANNQLFSIFVIENLAKETSKYLLKGMLVSIDCQLVKAKYSKFNDIFNLRANEISVIYINKSEYGRAKQMRKVRKPMYETRLPF